MKVSPHTHPESHLTGSTLANLVDRAKEMGRDYFAYTDNGHLSSALKAYGLCKPSKDPKAKEYQKRNLQFIPGIEIYFKDSSCALVGNTKADRCKYFTGTLYCKDQAAYQALCRMVSRTDMPTIEIYEEKQQLWSWDDLVQMSQMNVDFVAGGAHCMVGKCMLAGEPLVAQKVFLKLKEIFGHNFFVSILAEPWTKKWYSIVEIKYKDGTKDALMSHDMVSTDRARKIKVSDLLEKSHHTVIKSKYVGVTHYDVDKEIDSVKLHKGFLPLPGGDVTLKVNKLLLALANKEQIPVLVSDYAYYAHKDDKIVQTMRMEGSNKLQPNFYMKNSAEVEVYLTKTLGLGLYSAQEIIDNNAQWAKRFDGFKLKYDYRLAKFEGNPIKLAMDIIKKNGRMRWDNPMWVDRLKEELNVIAKNPVKDLTPYFLPISEVMDFYKEQGVLTGPLRGSCGGSLLCYLMGITQVDPFKYDLPFNRFFSLDRILTGKLPDIDSDLSSRDILVGPDGRSGFLYGKYGDKAAQISTRNTIRLKTAIKDTNRYFHGAVQPEIEALTKGLPAPMQGVSDHDMIFGTEVDDVHTPGLIETSDELQEYVEKRPDEWAIVEKALGITRSFGVHAAAFILSDEAIKDVVPLKDGNVAQYEMKEVEAAGLIKYDFLVVKQLKDIELCLNMINKKNGETNIIGDFTHEGKKLYIWDLPEVPEVFKSTWGGNTETLFQINTKSMTPFVQEILPQSIDDIGIILALVRPGPLDFIDEKTGRSMADEYVFRRRGDSEVDIPILGELVPETFGIFVYQESLTKIAKELAGFPGDEAEKLRENMGKKKMSELQKMKPKFIEGASKKVDQAVAEEIWERMVTFGRYGFNKSHSIGYAHITYACMFLKHFYPLEWWASILTNADESEITGTFWPYVKDIVLPPDINLSGDTMVVDYKNGKLRSKLGIIRGIGDATIEPIVNGRPYADIQEFVNKEVCGNSLAHKLIHVGVLDSLFPSGSSLVEKLKLYENACEIKSFNDKAAKAKAEGRKMRALQPREGNVPPEYVNLDKEPLKDAAMKKAVLPSMPLDLFGLGKKHSKAVDRKTSMPTALDTRGYRSMLINGERLKRLDEAPGEALDKDIYVASTCFIIQAKEFSYAKNTKKALKLIVDADGYISEKVLWPEYESGKLVYPPELKKGVIATVFFKKRAGKKDTSITGVVVET